MFSGGPSLTARLANIQHMPALIAATVASEKPTDGYLVTDVIKMSFESSQTRVFLQQYLLNQLLTSRNVYVKRKVLKLIEELLLRGHVEFKQNLRKQPEPLKEASRLRSSHSKDGGMVTECARIRDLANKILELLYEETPELQGNSYPSSEHRSTNNSSSSSRMEGFGNTSYVPKTKSSATSDKLRSLFGSSAKTTALVYDPGYATMDPVPHNVYAGSSSGYSSGGGYREHGAPEGAPHRSGEAGGGWGDGSAPSKPPPVREQVVKEDYYTENAQDYEERNTEQERRLVDDITAPGGIKAAPPRDSVNNFISRCKVLDCLAIVEFLRQKLQEEEQTQVVLRTLFVVEAMLKSDIPDIFSYLDLVLEELNGLMQSTNSSIRAKAKKILHQLVAEDSQRVTSSNTGSEAAVGVAPAGTGTILDLEGDIRREGEGEGRGDEENITEEGSAGVTISLFDGMSLSGQSPAGPSTATARHNRTHKKSSSPRQAARSQVEDKKKESNSPFGDLLGLSSSEMQSINQPPSQGTAEEEASLMDLGDDKDDFDPLTRTGSVGSKSNSLTRSSSLGNLKTTPISPPTASDSIMNQLSGLDLNVSAPLPQTDTDTAQNGLKTGLSGMLQPFQLHATLTSTYTPTSSISTPTSLLSGATATSQSPMGVIMGRAPVNYVNAQMAAHMAYMPASTPYAMQPVQGMAHQGIPAYGSTPVMMYMNQPRLGGDSRPVQRAQVREASPESGFDFLGKSNKGSAFDFVKEEIDSAKKK